MLCFGRGELVRQTVDRCGGGGHDFGHPGIDRCFHHIERPVHQHLHRQAGLLGALGDANGSLVKEHIHARHDARQQVRVADVPFDDRDRAVSTGPGQIGHPSACEVVKNDDLPCTFVDEQVGDVGADQAGSACDQDFTALQIHESPWEY